MNAPAAPGELEIRPERPADAAAIATLTRAAFRAAVHASHTEQYIVGALRRADVLALSLLATVAGAPVGHVALSPVSIADGTPDWFGLGPLAVLPAWQRQGVGARLVREALAMLRAQGAGGCVVLGEPAYYGRFGFVADPGLVLPGVPPGYFQALAFGAGRPRGAVAYHAAFEARD
jgi:putative acetyltransferase